ncbi:MAG: hypothetical protein WC708_04355 [Lentisphaeria bacterium]
MTAARLFLFSGTDVAGLDAAAKAQLRQLAGDHPEPWELEVIREREGEPPAETLGRLLAALQTPSFLGGRRTLCLEQFSAFAAEGKKGPAAAVAAGLEKLRQFLAPGVPPDVSLVLSGPGAPPDGDLAAVCQAVGEVRFFDKPDIKDRHWREAMAAVIRRRAAEKKLTLAEDAVRHLVEALGTDTERLEGELEKIICYVGGTGRPAALADVAAICQGDGEAVSWTLLDAIGERRLDEALRLVGVLIAADKNPDGAVLGLLRSVTGLVRHLLQLRLYAQECKARTGSQLAAAIEGLPAADRAAALANGLEAVGLKGFRLSKLAGQCFRYNGAELNRALIGLRETSWRAMAGNVAARVYLEAWLLETLPPAAAASR